MFNVREKSPYAGMTVKTKPDVGSDMRPTLGNCEFVIEDWWQNVAGVSWIDSGNDYRVRKYALRIGGTKVPVDDEVLYGKIGPSEYLFHVSELCLPEVT